MAGGFTLIPDQPGATTPPASTPVPTPEPTPAPAALAFTLIPDQPSSSSVATAAPTASPFTLIPDQPAAQPAAPTPSLSETVTQPPAGEQRSGFFSGLYEGGQAALQQGGRTLSGQAFTDDPNAQPEPQRGFFNSLGYGLGYSSPTLAAGLGGGAAGTSVGGPIGGIVGAGLGAGLATFAQDLAPAYAQARQTMDHDAAVNYALEHAATSGGVVGLTAGIIPPPIRSVLGRILAQTFVVQPVAGAVTRTAVPAIMGEPLPTGQQYIEGLGQDIITGAGFAGAHAGIARGREALTPPVRSPGPEATAAATQAMTPTGVPSPTEQVMPALSPVSAPSAAPETPPTAPTGPPAPEPPVASSTQAGAPRAPTPPVSATPTEAPGSPAIGQRPGQTAEPEPVPPVATASTPPEAPVEPGVVQPQGSTVEPRVPTGEQPAPPTPSPPAAPATPGVVDSAGKAVNIGDTVRLTSESGNVNEAKVVGIIDGRLQLELPGGARTSMGADVIASRPDRLLVQGEPVDRSAAPAGEPAGQVPVGEPGARAVEPPRVPEPPGGGTDQGGRAPGVEPEAPVAAPPEAGPRTGEPAPTVEPYSYSPMDTAQPTEGKTFYHGTKAPIDSMKNVDVWGYSDVRNLYGHGLYLTDHPDVANSYATSKGRGGPGKVFKVNVHDLNLVDLEKPLDQPAQAAFQKSAGEYLPADTDFSRPGKEVFGQLKEAMRDEGLTTSDATDVYDNVTAVLSDAGYDGFRYEGGAFRGKDFGKHNALVLFENGTLHPDGTVTGRVTDKFTELGQTPAKVPGEPEPAAGQAEPGPVRLEDQAAAGPRTSEEPVATPETSTLAEPLTTEPDHVVPNQYVAKDATGEVVGKGPTPEAALADARGEQPVESRVGREKGFEGVPEVGRPKTVYDYQFNPGASPFRGVIVEMGEDPASFAQKGVDQQATMLQKHVANKFGFNSVSVERSAGTGRPDARRAVDAMMNTTRAATDGMASMGLPLEALSDFGRLRLVYDPEGKVSYFGSYTPAKGEIRLQGGANSLGHEWIHAIDHTLAERLTSQPAQMNRLLSMYTREGKLNTSDNVQAAFAKLINTVFYDEGALAMKRLQLETDALKTNAQGQPTAAAKTAQDQLDRLDKGGSRLGIQMSEFRKNAIAINPKQAGYFANAWELLGRSGEAYLASKMDQAGRDPRGFVMPNEGYLDNTDRFMSLAYPKGDDRARVFKAWDELFQAMHNEGVLNQGKPAATFTDYGVSDPKYWNVTAPGLRQTPQGLALSRQLNASRSFYQRLYNAMPYDRSRPTPGEHTFKRSLTDSFRGAAFSYRGNIQTLINRAPPAARALMQEGLNRLATDPGSGKLVHRTFEEAIRYGENLDQGLRAWMRRYADALSQTALDPNNSTVEEQQMLRHFLTTGEKTYPVDPLDPSAGVKVMPANIAPAAEQTRKLLNDVWHAMQDAKIDVGYAKSGFFPRLYNLQKIFSDTIGFKKAAAHTYKFMFDQAMGAPGSDPGSLVEQWMGLKRDERANADPAVQGQMQTLVKNLGRQAEIEQNPAPTPAETAELAQLRQDAEALAKAAHDPVGNHVAEVGASEWLGRVLSGNAHDFTETGMSGSFMKGRKLPPEADLFMRDFMHTNPFDAIPQYLNSAARKIAIVERFGNNTEDGTPQELDRIRKGMIAAGVRGEDIQSYIRYMNMVLGRDNTAGTKPLERLTTLAHAAGSLVLMPRAMWSSLAEPMNANLVTGHAGAGFRILASQVGQAMNYLRSRPSEITELAHFLNVTTSPMMDSIILSRMGADYADRPALNRLLSWYYKVTGLTQLTNSQRIGAVASANWFLARLARQYKGTNARDKAEAERWFRELGMSDRIHDKFAQFMLDQNGGRPAIDTLKTHDMGSAYGLAIGRIVDRVIQDPYKVDTPVGAGNPVTRLAFQLMHFNYSYQKNVLNPMWENITHSYGQAKMATGSRTRGFLAAGGTMANTAAMAGTVLGAGLLVNMVRQSIFAPDQWKEHEDKGDLWEWLRDLTFQRSGFNGTLDPIIQVYSHLRYDSDIASLMEGASVNYLAKNLQDVIQPFVTANDSPNSNTRYYNQARGAFNLIGVPAAAVGLTMLGQAGGPFTRLASGAALQLGTSPYAAGRVAAAAAGDKGTKLPKEGEGLQGLQSMGALQELPSAEADETTGAGTAATPGGVGLLDDVAVPAWRYGQGVASKVPGPLKALAAAGALGYAVNDYFGKTAPFREQSALNREENQ